MASKELTTAVILAITNAERKGINLEPLDSLDQMLLNDEEYIRPLAEAAISTILAALQEPTEEMINAVFDDGNGSIKDDWQTALNASPLAE